MDSLRRNQTRSQFLLFACSVLLSLLIHLIALNGGQAYSLPVVDTVAPASATLPAQWKILALIYPTTDFSYVDGAGVVRRVVAQMTVEQKLRAAGAVRRFVGTDIPALTSGHLIPTVEVRYVQRSLDYLEPFCRYTPSPVSVAPELDPAFDSVIVIWASTGTDVSTGEQIHLNHCGGETRPNGTGPTYTTIPVGSVATNQRNVFKHEWGHAILYYFDATGTAPQPTVNNHINDTDTRYVNCITGEPYILQDETDDNPIPNSIYHNESGFTHDYYSGLTATADQPTRCLGITPEAWASPPPSQWSLQTNQ